MMIHMKIKLDLGEEMVSLPWSLWHFQIHGRPYVFHLGVVLDGGLAWQRGELVWLCAWGSSTSAAELA